jgi:hypothetical protein
MAGSEASTEASPRVPGIKRMINHGASFVDFSPTPRLTHLMPAAEKDGYAQAASRELRFPAEHTPRLSQFTPAFVPFAHGADFTKARVENRLEHTPRLTQFAPDGVPNLVEFMPSLTPSSSVRDTPRLSHLVPNVPQTQA